MAATNPYTPFRVFTRFLGLGLQAWGDSTARLAVLYKELVQKEGWVSNLTFARAYAVYQALPGPEALEMAVHLGYRRSGRLGGLLAGIGFVLPGFLLMLLLAQVYVMFGREAWGLQGILYAITPVVIALIVHAIVKIARATLRNEALVHLALASFLASFLLPVNLALVIFVLGAGYFLVRNDAGSSGFPATALTPFVLGKIGLLGLPILALMSLFFLEAGLLTFGGSFTVLPFIEQGAVRDFGWFSQETFLDAVALCALVPAPLVIVGGFLGYLLGGVLGALIGTISILLPAFGFTLVKPAAILRLVESPRARDFFDGVTASVVGLVAVTAIRLSGTAITDPGTLAIAIGAFLILLAQRVNAVWVVAGAAVLGLGLETLNLVG